MPIKLDCPRCRKPLAVPTKKAGSYATCPNCNGRLWVPEKKTEPATPGSVSTGGQSPQPATPPPTPLATPPPAPTPPTPSPQPPTPQTPVDVPPVQAPVPGRKVARFVSAEAAQSTLQASEDGQLPELQLQEGEKKKKQQARERTVSPAVLLGALSMSVVLSMMMVLSDAGPEDNANVKAKRDARTNIQMKHFAEPGALAPSKPYQRLLREAQLAHERKNFRSERQKYREVLDLLRQERGATESTIGRRFEGVTGSVADDKELEGWIRTLLKED